jgi:sugar (pentulose or hexulose) kinase
MNARAPSMPVGQITLTHMTSAFDPNPRRHLTRSVIEGYACAVRANLEQLSEVTGYEFSEIRLAGGMSQSDLLAQILSNVTQARVAPVAIHEATALGAALCAGVAAGLYSDFGAAVEASVENRKACTPVESDAESSQKLYQSWCKLREAGAETTAPAAAAHVTPWVLNPHYS